MDDRELLKQYEPVLRFAKSERFFPMAVEPYLERCHILPSGPQGAVGLLSNFTEALTQRIGELHSGEYFLRFVNDPLTYSRVWLGWGVLSAAALSLGWFEAGLHGVEAAFILALIAALIIFIRISPIRARIFPALLAVLFFFTLEAAPVWFFLTPHSFISRRVEYLVLFPLYLFGVFYLSVRTMKFIFDYIIPELPGLLMDMLSQATETVARKSYQQYAGMSEAERQPVYYGRVVYEREDDVDWKILQYHFFYAFNDWRLGANGVNHHEGDWEMAAVYLKNDAPYAVLFSQHGSGAMELWQNVRRVKDSNGNETTHPLIYTALGSHANYSKPEVIRSPNLFDEGYIQRFVYWTDGLIHFLFLLFNPSQRQRQIALRQLALHPATALTEESFANMRDKEDHYVVSLPMEIATGDGFRIGYHGDHRHEEIGKSTSYLKRMMSDRKVTHPPAREWKQMVLNPEPDWIQYQGLWGVKSLLADESGPPGPKWSRPDQFFMIHPRKRWERPLEWLRELESRRLNVG
ncbi:MAG: hypothetical protein ABI986_09105 [Chloroflexota bacterium]